MASSFYDFPIKGIDGGDNLLNALRGNVALAVNVASKCGLTPQYTGLERLYRELKGQRFAVIGFPCNQFAGQEPGTESEISTFCSTTYDVTFPLTVKLDVNGPTRHPLYAWLTDPANGFPGDIQWNFEKFLISRDGKILHRYPPTTKPEDNGLMTDIGAAL
jgi:glutathione peroxidase